MKPNDSAKPGKYIISISADAFKILEDYDKEVDAGIPVVASFVIEKFKEMLDEKGLTLIVEED